MMTMLQKPSMALRKRSKRPEVIQVAFQSLSIPWRGNLILTLSCRTAPSCDQVMRPGCCGESLMSLCPGSTFRKSIQGAYSILKSLLGAASASCADRRSGWWQRFTPCSQPALLGSTLSGDEGLCFCKGPCVHRFRLLRFQFVRLSLFPWLGFRLPNPEQVLQ